MPIGPQDLIKPHLKELLGDRLGDFSPSLRNVAAGDQLTLLDLTVHDLELMPDDSGL